MPRFAVVPLREAIERAAPFNLQEYVGYIKQLGSGQAGKLTPGEGETALTVRRRLTTAAKLAGKRVVLVDAAEYAALKRRLTEITDALEKISRGDAAYRQGRTKSVSSLSELGR